MQLWKYGMLSFFDQDDEERRKGHDGYRVQYFTSKFLSSSSSFLSNAIMVSSAVKIYSSGLGCIIEKTV